MCSVKDLVKSFGDKSVEGGGGKGAGLGTIPKFVAIMTANNSNWIHSYFKL